MYFEAHYKKYNYAKDFRKAALGTLNYISRKGKEPVFGFENMELDEAKDIINMRSELWPRRFWRMILSPDIEEENKAKNLDMWELARKTLSYIREDIDKNVAFIFAEHTDTNIPHIQGLVFFNGKLNIEDLEQMKTLAHEYALGQNLVREEAREFLESIESIRQFRDVTKEYPSVQRVSQNARSTEHLAGAAGGKAHRVRYLKPPALACPTGGINHRTVRTKTGKSWCLSCEKVVKQSRGLSL